MDLSIIIPTRNRSTLLSSTLESIVKQSISKDRYEVIVVDNGSTDETKQVCDTFNPKFKFFTYLYEETPGLHVGRHAGLKAAKSDILVYADDDIEAFPTWLESIAECFADEKVAMVGGKCLPKFESEPPEWLLQRWTPVKEKDLTLGCYSLVDLGDEKKEINPSCIYGCNLSIRKQVLLNAGGFHPDGMPEDMLQYRGDGETHVSSYVMEKGYRVIYHPKASVFHVVPTSRMTVKYLYKRWYMQGISDSYSNIRTNGLRIEIKLMLIMMKGTILMIGRNDITTQMKRSYWKGYRFHRRCVKSNPILYNWITKKDYLIG